MLKNNKINHRITTQKIVIYNLLLKNSAHLTARQIYQAVQSDLPQISLATVYRNLNKLLSEKKISCLSYNNQVRYEAKTDNHYHFICTKCDKVMHVNLDEYVELNEQISKRHNVVVQNHQLYFFGLCNNCLKSK